MNKINLISSCILALAAMVSSAAHAAPHGVFRTFQANKTLSQVAGTQKLLYYGGPVIGNVKVYAVFWGANVSATTQKDIGGFFTSLSNSTHMDWLSQYNTNITAVDGRAGTGQAIGRGTYGGEFLITPANTSQDLLDADIQKELEHQIDIGALPKPDDNTLYMTYFPPGVGITIENQKSCQAFCAYHEGFKSQTHGNVFYGVMPDLESGACSFGCGFASDSFSNLTTVSSHEFIEAVTDPFPTPATSPAFPQAWNTSDGNEIGDLCAGSMTTLTTANRTYTIQQEFDNSTQACSPGPFSSK